MKPEELAAKLTERFGPGTITVEPFPRSAGRVRFPREKALELFRAMKDDLGFLHLSMVGATDWVDHREVFYVLWSDLTKEYVLLSTDVPANDAHLESATPVWPSANWHEREAWELVDVTFDHHPDLRHLLTPDGYAFHPLLRSFQLHEPEELEVKVRDV